LNEVQRARLAGMDEALAEKVKAARGLPVFRRLVARYGRADYWEGRHRRALQGEGGYEGDRHEEWYFGWEELGPVLDGLIDGAKKKGMRVMNVGCGTGKMAEALAVSGFGNVVHTDVSPSCVELMREVYGGKLEGHAFEVDDATQMRYASEEFDVVLDKGTLDALHCAGDAPCLAMVSEVQRVLKPGGKYVIVSQSFKRSYFNVDDGRGADGPGPPWTSLDVIHAGTVSNGECIAKGRQVLVICAVK